MQFLIFMAIIIAILLWIAITTAGIVLIVCSVDGCQYGGPRFRDWRDPILTIGGVVAYIAIMSGILIAMLQPLIHLR